MSTPITFLLYFAIKKNMDKIRYRLVYNRKKKLNKQGTALVQVECSLNGRKIYLTTNVYLRPECWDKEVSQVFFYLWYIIEWLIRLIQYRDTKKAYRNISFEREAYANQNSINYLQGRSIWNWIHYLKST